MIARIAETLHGCPDAPFEVGGHTDSQGSDSYNQTLSERRANSVADYLANKGMPRARMVTIGAGEGHPVASNDTEEGRAQNRRVEITIVPVSEENVQKAKAG